MDYVIIGDDGGYSAVKASHLYLQSSQAIDGTAIDDLLLLMT